MELNEYQALAEKTAVYRAYSVDVQHFTYGLCSEAGEVAEVWQKYFRGDYGVDQIGDKIQKELGDVLWHVAVLAGRMGFSLEAIAKINLNKLAKRKAEGTIKGSGDDR